MGAVGLVLTILSALLIAAHCLRAGLLALVALALAFPLLLVAKRAWATRLVQGLLVLAGAEWVRALLVLAAERRAAEHPWIRMAVILGVVAALTFAAAVLLRAPTRAPK